MTQPATNVPLQTRAVQRTVEEDNPFYCNGCDKHISYMAPGARRYTGERERRQIVCNVYERGKWNRTEYYHPGCYEEAGQPYGPPAGNDNEQAERRKKLRRQAAAERRRRGQQP